ncbi:ABC transporter permease [Fulvivirga lutea]|uniref:ABC transporter permease n=2 Tax=Fulvivirga lutea TaxID=2810512 RepID=A0A974WKC4_9BACT|nr:ABC transporter permease [Fulvivirga lutea]
MIRNYLKIALRNILGQKVYSTINILGLAVGMAATILISLYVQHELSYDEYHTKSDRIYRASREWLNANGESSLHLGHLAPPFGPFLATDFDGILEEVVRINSGYGPLMSYNDKKFEEDGFFWAEGNLFHVFSWKFIEGDPKTALTEPNAIVLTQSAADRYFSGEDPMGKSITFNNFGTEVDFKITGIIQDSPPNSHFQFSMFASFVTLENFFGRENMMQNWGSNNYATYLLLEEGKSIEELESQIPAFIDKHLGEHGGEPASTTNKLHFMPLTDIHLHSHLDSEIEANSDIKYVYTYTIIAVFILIIACINFMNLSTARSMKRAKEVGVRKVMGAFRSSLIRQFITESVLIASISAILSLGLVVLVLPWFNDFSGKQLSFTTVDPLFFAALMVGVVLAVGFLAGSYPAFFLSSFAPVKVLKGSKLNSHKKLNLRSALVVFQFFISICLLIGVGVINDQIEYMKTKDLGFNKENMVVLPSNNEIHANFELIRNRLMEQPSIEDVTFSSRVPSGRLLDSQGGEFEIDGEMKRIDFRVADIHVDHSYLKTLDVKFLAGRNFDHKLASDSSEAFILNKAAIEALGYSSMEEAIDKKFNYGGRNGYIIGVVDDFHFESLKQEIAPIVFVVTQGRARFVIVKVKDGQEDEAVAYLKEEWTHLREGFPFDYYTIGDRFNSQYEAEEKLGELVNYFSFLAIFVAILGLFGLSSFSVEQNLKEIGIRKVLGASVKQVVYMFTKRFALLVIIGIAIAIPVSYYGMDQWLAEFPYATDLEPVTFIIGSVVALAFALITVSFEIVRGAVSNPVNTLRNE